VGKRWYNFFVVTEGQDVPPAAPGPAPVAPPPRRVVDVVPDADVEQEFTAPVKNPAEFQEIYTAAHIGTPSHGYTVLKVADMLKSEHIQALPADVKRKSILVALDAAGVKINEIIEDAVQRDRALDAFERVLQKHLQDLQAAKETENKRLEEEINKRLAELRAQIDENNKELTREQDNLLNWRSKKRQEEERIAEAVSHFVSENPITTANTSAEKKGGTDNVR